MANDRGRLLTRFNYMIVPHPLRRALRLGLLSWMPQLVASPAVASPPATTAEEEDDDALDVVRSESSPDANPNETRVRGIARKRDTSVQTGSLSSSMLATSQPEEALTSIPGLVLTRSGGPLASTTVQVRGVGGARVTVDVGGLPLNDPASGELDASMIPVTPDMRFQTSSSFTPKYFGHALSITPRLPYAPFLRFQLGAGTIGTMRAQMIGSTPTQDGGQLYVAASAARTDGDFSFRPSSTFGDLTSKVELRQNNDQQRGSLFASATSFAGPATVEFIGLANAHEGGIPGFATAPSETLRGARSSFGGLGRVSLDLGEGELVMHAQARHANRRVISLTRRDVSSMSSTQNNVGLAFHSSRFRLPSSDDLTFHVWSTSEESRVPRQGFARRSVSLGQSTELELLNGGVQLAIGGGLDGHSDVGLIPSARLALVVGRGGVHGGLLLTRGGRAPSLDELYAPRGIVLGNPNLLPEQSSDTEFFFTLAQGRITELRLAVFAGRLDDTILYLNQNAFEVRPVNTGPAWRAGAEAHLAARPHPWVSVDVITAALLSQMDTTGAPLPNAPPLSTMATLTLGAPASYQLGARMNFRHATPTTLFGTLSTRTYTLFDVVAHIPIAPGLRVTPSVSNAFDVLSAQDTNLLPLPGRQFFCVLEVEYG